VNVYGKCALFEFVSVAKTTQFDAAPALASGKQNYAPLAPIHIHVKPQSFV
jgi:hypothetical protein